MDNTYRMSKRVKTFLPFTDVKGLSDGILPRGASLAGRKGGWKQGRGESEVLVPYDEKVTPGMKESGG